MSYNDDCKLDPPSIFISGFFVGVVLVYLLSRWNVIDNRDRWINEYTKKPYCEKAEVRGKVLKRCWKVLEIEELDVTGKGG